MRAMDRAALAVIAVLAAVPVLAVAANNLIA